MTQDKSALPEAGGNMVLIERGFDAPRDLVFKAWTDPAHLARWFAPRGCTIRFATLEIRPGGRFHSCIHNPDFGECWCVGVYREIVAPERIVFTMATADAHGNLSTPVAVGHAADWPAETIVTVTFTEEGGKTKLVLHQNVLASIAKRTGAYPSWLQMLDRLEEQVTGPTG